MKKKNENKEYNEYYKHSLDKYIDLWQLLLRKFLQFKKKK